MNTDNTNLDNNIGSESLGAINTPINSEPVNNVGEETFSPFQDLNSAPLNVPTENVSAAPQPEFQTEPDFSNSSPVDSIPSAPQETLSEPIVSNAAPVNNTDVFNAAPVSEPVPAEVPASFTTEQAAPVVDTFEPVQAAPVVDAIPEVPQTPEVVPAEVNNNVGLNDVVMQNTMQMNTVTSVPNETPTMPIPDQMPVTDYQAGVSTPVDYATPMSNFDEIGTTPELDPNAKGKKKSNKFLVIILLLAIIGGIGYGCYYAINVMGILDSSSVTLKQVTAEKGDALSTNIEDYATFKNTSSSNCVLDTSKVDINVASTYSFTVTCGKKSYTGKVTVKDTKAPEIEVKTNIVIAGTQLSPEMLIASASEEAKYSYASDSEVEQFKTAGLKKIKVNVTDNNSNTKTYVIPVIVTSSEYSMGIVSKKDVTEGNTDATIYEKNVILYNNSGGNVNDTSYTAYIIKFSSGALYNAAVKNYDDSGMLTYDKYSGTPLFYVNNNTLVLVKDINTSLIKESFNDTFSNLNGQNGYQAFLVNQIGTNKQLLDFNNI